MVLVYRTTGAWGAGKGSSLTSVEGDTNLYELATRMLALEEDPPTAIGISNIQVIGSQFKIILADATEFGPYPLPVAAFHFRPEGWLNDNTYLAFDLIPVTDIGLFLVLVEHETPESGSFDALANTGAPDFLPLYAQMFGTAQPGTPDSFYALEHAAFDGI